MGDEKTNGQKPQGTTGSDDWAESELAPREYGLRAYGRGRDGGEAKAVIRRHQLDAREQPRIAVGATNLSQAQFGAYERAKDLVRRNGPGDRERALELLRAVFDDVFQIGVGD